jgi:hypothetical protein
VAGFKSIDHMNKMKELVKLGKLSQAKFDEWMKVTPSLTTLPQRVVPKIKNDKRKYHK